MATKAERRETEEAERPAAPERQGTDRQGVERQGVERQGVERQSAEQRHNGIVQLVRQRGFITIEALAKHFGVTVQTIRRDLNMLSDENRVSRYRGGAGLPSSVENFDYTARQIMNLSEKARIARLVARRVPDHSSLFINIGTTTEAVAHELCRHQDLRIITNNLNVATILSRNTDFQVIVTGGTVRNHDGGITGPSTTDMIEQFSVDYALIGISGISLDGMLLDYDYDEVRAAQTIIRNARHVFLAADHSKFIRRPLVRVASLAEVTCLFTDEPPPAEIRDFLAQHQVELEVAAEELDS